jgi:tRNA-splicing ligase RtcB
VVREADWLPLPVGAEFAALLTHSGSRGVGHAMATHYSSLAAERTNLIARGIPKEYAWLNIDDDAGREYLQVMRLMGRYAQANHHLIHAHFLRRTGLSALPVKGSAVELPHVTTPFTVIENHHNFAWVEGDLVIHRKGATPAGRDVAGLIPGSSGTKSYLVKGLSNPDSLESSSHGAGRPFSRTEAKRRHDPEFFRTWMADHDILYKGVAPDETLMAYKDIETVIGLQTGVLVDIVAEMFPVAVQMGGRSDDGD